MASNLRNRKAARGKSVAPATKKAAAVTAKTGGAKESAGAKGSTDGKRVLPGGRRQDDSALRKSFNRAQKLLDISREVAGFENLTDVLRRFVEITTAETNAERATIFLNDEDTGELYSRVAQGDLIREIRVLNDTGVAGHVFQTGTGEIIHDAYASKFFNPTVDQQTGFTTKSILCEIGRAHV